VDVGRARELKTSRSNTLASITATNIIVISGKVNSSGWKIPFLATSIIPVENKVPNINPILATNIITQRGATLEPIAELRKFTASLLTPTINPMTAKTSKTITAIKYTSNSIPKVIFSNTK